LELSIEEDENGRGVGPAVFLGVETGVSLPAADRALTFELLSGSG